MAEKNRESFIFYRSFFEALLTMSADVQGKCLMALAEYALNGKDPEMTPEVRLFFTLAKPQIDANNKKYENGCKGAEFGKFGGRPKKNPNKTPEKPLDNPNKTPNDNVNDNDNVNVNDNISPFYNSDELYLSPYMGNEKCSCDCERKAKFEINGKRFCGQHTRIELSKLGRLDLISKSFGNVFNKNKVLVSSQFSISNVPDLKCYVNEMPEDVIDAVEKWLINTKSGQMVDISFITKQFFNFAKRMGRPVFKEQDKTIT